MLDRVDSSFCQTPRPSTFAGLMELYEANYIRLRRLCGELSDFPTQVVSTARGALDLHLTLLERSPYTTSLVLTYLLPDAQGTPRPDPNLVVKVYHDARQAEALSREPGAHWRARAGGDSASALEAKWRLNRFLYKWLGYCAHQGHGHWSTEHAPLSVARVGASPSLVD
ncbi:MAG: DUF1249 domain-containing protein [Chromatiales bacterium]|jgi:uncharacterized protein YqiB (DUF1249 family)